jgi:hypothetical protein
MEEEVKAIAVVAMTQLPWVCTEVLHTLSSIPITAF